MAEPVSQPKAGEAPPQPASQSQRRVRWGLLSIVAVATLGLLALFGYGLILAGRSGGIGINAVGGVGRIPPGPAPDFEIPLFSGGSFQLAQQHGKIVLINFWASWCVPCRDEAPRLEAADIQDTPENARAFLHELGVRYPNGLDEEMKITKAHRVIGLPTTLIVDRDGSIRQRWQGELQDGQLDDWIATALR